MPALIPMVRATWVTSATKAFCHQLLHLQTTSGPSMISVDVWAHVAVHFAATFANKRLGDVSSELCSAWARPAIHRSTAKTYRTCRTTISKR